METISIYNVKELKNDIKKLSAIQVEIRNQRKDVHIKGERTMKPKDAQYQHIINGEKLRIMFAAYGLMRGKSFSVTENNHPATEEHPLNKYKNQIDKILQAYTIQVPAPEVAV